MMKHAYVCCKMPMNKLGRNLSLNYNFHFDGWIVVCVDTNKLKGEWSHMQHEMVSYFLVSNPIEEGF